VIRTAPFDFVVKGRSTDLTRCTSVRGRASSSSIETCRAFGAGFQLDLRSFSCPGTINWADDPNKEFFENLSLHSRIVWVLYLTVGGEMTPLEYSLK
jgi:hypothetical protein